MELQTFDLVSVLLQPCASYIDLYAIYQHNYSSELTIQSITLTLPSTSLDDSNAEYRSIEGTLFRVLRGSEEFSKQVYGVSNYLCVQKTSAKPTK